MKNQVKPYLTCLTSGRRAFRYWMQSSTRQTYTPSGIVVVEDKPKDAFVRESINDSGGTYISHTGHSPGWGKEIMDVAVIARGLNDLLGEDGNNTLYREGIEICKKHMQANRPELAKGELKRRGVFDGVKKSGRKLVAIDVDDDVIMSNRLVEHCVDVLSYPDIDAVYVRTLNVGYHPYHNNQDSQHEGNLRRLLLPVGRIINGAVMSLRSEPVFQTETQSTVKAKSEIIGFAKELGIEDIVASALDGNGEHMPVKQINNISSTIRKHGLHAVTIMDNCRAYSVCEDARWMINKGYGCDDLSKAAAMRPVVLSRINGIHIPSSDRPKLKTLEESIIISDIAFNWYYSGHDIGMFRRATTNVPLNLLHLLDSLSKHQKPDSNLFNPIAISRHLRSYREWFTKREYAGEIDSRQLFS